ncbi:FAD-dependent oxidoreductase [Rhodobacterales bacterium HKCCE2091]|nr:FAD-dependent oxidoreductase [Rhodobacterales bacterium HKCCE2091]
MTGTHSVSLWDVSAEEPPPAVNDPVSGRYDLAIVGGGYTGLSTALFAAEAGMDCIVLEAEKIGFGGSGRNVGLVNAGIWMAPAALRAKIGEAAAARLLDRFGSAPARVFNLIETHQIRCNATRTGTLHCATSVNGLADLEERWSDWNALGAPVEIKDAGETARLTGSDAFAGALLDHRAGTVQPMAYARGLARAARGAGARIATGARVERLTRDASDWRLSTRTGEVRAAQVVLATNAYTDGLWPGLAQAYTPIDYMQVATAPLGDAAAGILPEGQGLWTNGQVMISVRRDAAGRIVIGSMGRVIGPARGGLTRRWAARQLERLYPRLGPVRFAQAWHGRIALTPDKLPRILHLAEGLYAPTGYNGRGITTGTILGEAIAGLLSGRDDACLPLPLSPPAPDRGARLRAPLYAGALAAHQIMLSL